MAQPLLIGMYEVRCCDAPCSCAAREVASDVPGLLGPGACQMSACGEFWLEART
jgi:hypothetical protein